MSDFSEFLKGNATTLFAPGVYDESAKKTWTPGSKTEPVASAVLDRAEATWSVLPVGYRVFMETLGPGIWCGAAIAHPDHIYAFDEQCGAMQGFLVLAFNVDGCGNSVAVNPADVTEKMAYCCHDPFGYAGIAPDFEQWIRQIAKCQIEDPKIGVREYYDSVAGFKEIVPPGMETGKPWWQFWK